jgi:hypothetical protein
LAFEMRITTNPHLPPTLRYGAASNPLPQPEEEEDAKRLVRVTRLVLTLSLIVISQLASCETTNYVPPVTPQMAVASSRMQDVDLTKLREGRTLFVHRCIECHTLPAIWHYTSKDWTEIVNDMSHRASLKPAERDAVIAYILAVRAQM